VTDTVTINQSLSVGEVISASFFIFPRLRIIRRFLLYILILAIGSAVLGALTTSNNTGGLPTLIALLLPIILLPIVFFAFILIISVLVYAARPYIYKNVRFQFNHWGVVKTSDRFEISKPWREFTQYAESKSFFILFISASGGHIIAKRAFHSDEEMEQFRNLLQANLSESSTI